MKWLKNAVPTGLVANCPVTVRFSEVDAMGVAWHGNYLKFIEDGREYFGAKYGLSYHLYYGEGYTAPIVKFYIDYKQAVRYGDRLTVATRYLNSPGAKLFFHYGIYNESRDALAAEAWSMQVFLDAKSGELQLQSPKFYDDWRRKCGL